MNLKIKALVLLFLVPALFSRAEVFKFAILGDSQLHNPEVFESLVLEVELLSPDFVIQVGDLIHGYTYDPGQIRMEWELFKQQIAPLSMPFYPVAGNHDVGTLPLEEIYGEIWGRDKYYYSFDHKGSHFAILDTDYQLSYGKITDNQMKWLSKDLDKNKDAEHIFIFMHRPLWRDRKSNWGELASLLNKYENVRSVYAGHTHEYCLEIVDNLRCFIINSSGNMNYSAPSVGYFHQFLYVSVKGEEVKEAVIPAGTVKPPDYVTREERSRAAPYFSPPSGGQIPDPVQNPLDIIYSFPLKNRTREMNVFTVRWEIPNPAFTVEPLEQAILLAPGRTEEVFINIKAPSGKYAYYSLPYASIETYYNTLRGESVVLRSRHELSIPPETTAQYTSKPPFLDGVLDDTAWQSASTITDFQINKVGDPAKVQTWVKTLFDEENLYIGVHLEEPHPENLVALASGPVPYTFGDDDVEIFLDTNHDMASYARVFVNPKGTTFNSMPGKGLVPEWHKHAEHVGKDYWAAELALPFRELGIEDAPSSSTIWGFNVRRHRMKPMRVQSDWVKMRNVPYEPWRFGVLRFNR